MTLTWWHWHRDRDLVALGQGPQVGDGDERHPGRGPQSGWWDPGRDPECMIEMEGHN